jgi:hypothetical protein
VALSPFFLFHIINLTFSTFGNAVDDGADTSRHPRFHWTTENNREDWDITISVERKLLKPPKQNRTHNKNPP